MKQQSQLRSMENALAGRGPPRTASGSSYASAGVHRSLYGTFLSEMGCCFWVLIPPSEARRSITHADSSHLLLTTAEASKALRISQRKLWSLTAPRGDLPCVRIGRNVLYTPADLDRFIEANKATTVS